MVQPELNLQVLRRSRKALRAGDIFAYRLKGLDFGFGRVIRTETGVYLKPSPGTYLVYFYRAFSPEENVIPALRREQLLLPPKIIGRELWTLGCFENVDHRPLTSEDVLPVHCFYSYSWECCVDEYARHLQKRIEPCGSWGLTGYALLDYYLSEARGIPPHPATIADPERDFGGGGRHRTKVSKSKRKRRDVDHALLVCISGPGRRGKRAEFCDRVFEFEDQLEELVTREGVGWMDGNEIAVDLSSATIYLYGKDAERLASVVVPVLRTAELPAGSYALKRYGSPGDAEERVDL